MPDRHIRQDDLADGAVKLVDAHETPPRTRWIRAEVAVDLRAVR